MADHYLYLFLSSAIVTEIWNEGKGYPPKFLNMPPLMGERLHKPNLEPLQGCWTMATKSDYLSHAQIDKNGQIPYLWNDRPIYL